AKKTLDAVNKEIETASKAAAVAEKGRKDAENTFKAAENAFKQAEQNAGEDKAPIDKARTTMDLTKKTLQEKTKQATNTKTAAEKVKADKLEPAKKKLSEAQTGLDRSGEFKMVRELKSHSQPVTHLTTLVTNPNQVLSGSKDGQAILWDTSNGSATRRFALGKPISSIAVSPDGKKFATAGDITFRLWAENGQQVAESKGNRYAIESVAFAETEAKFTVGELKYREGELKKR
ncbi:uncharacterized protein METZ01_LOCUS506043, partial [marine metagenome]